MKVTLRIEAIEDMQIIATDAFAEHVGREVPFTALGETSTATVTAVEVIEQGKAVAISLDVPLSDAVERRLAQTKGDFSIAPANDFFRDPLAGLGVKPVPAIPADYWETAE